VGGEPAQDHCGVLDVGEHEPANDGVAALLQLQLADVGLGEAEVRQTRRQGSFAGELDRVGRTVDAEHAAFLANDLRGEEGHATAATAGVEHVHAARDPGQAQHLPRQLAEVA
jgi:hypothetical protein